MSRWKELREGWDREVSVSRGRARYAVLALAATAATHAFRIMVAAWQIALLNDAAGGAQVSMETLQLSDTLFQGAAFVELGLLLVTGVLFLRWLARTVTTARTMIAEPHLRWTASQAVWGFFIPFVNLARPYHVMRDLSDRLEPDAIPEPAPQPKLDGVAGYRDIEMKKPPKPGPLPHASIGAWWALYIFAGVVGYSAASPPGTDAAALIWNRKAVIVSSAAEIAAAVLAVLVVRAIDGRLAERHRRVRHASKEELREWAIVTE